MSAETTKIRWDEDEALALDACVVKMTNLTGHPVTRPDAVKALVRAYAAGMTVDRMLRKGGV